MAIGKKAFSQWRKISLYLPADRARPANWNIKLKPKSPHSLAENLKAGLARYAGKFGRQRHLLDGSWKWNTRDIYELQEAIKRYVREEACPRLGFEPNVQPRIEMPLAGARSLIWFIKGGARNAALRAYPVESADEGRLHRDAVKLLTDHRVNAPRLIHYSEDFERYRAVILLEEFVEGKTRDWNGFSEKDIRQVAGQLSRLHSIHDSRWGPLGEERTGDFFQAAMRRIQNHLDIARQEKLFAMGSSESDLRNWFQGWAGSFSGIREFSLTHGDVHRNNGVFTDDGEYHLLDFSTFQWALPASDIVRNYQKLCVQNPERIREFNDAYFSGMSDADHHAVMKFIPFYEAQTRLGAAAMRSKRIQKSSGPQEADIRRGEWSEQKRREAWSELLELVANNTAPKGNNSA